MYPEFSFDEVRSQREWLLSHGIIKTETQKKRDQLTVDMNNYYYDTKVCTSWVPIGIYSYVSE